MPAMGPWERRHSIPPARRRRDSAAAASPPDTAAVSSRRPEPASAARSASAAPTPSASELAWRRIDLHVHTPVSTDYQQPNASTLDILHRAEERGLDIIALTDHNSVRGYADLWREIEDLELLEYLGRLQPNEAERLAAFRRLLRAILVLPGFEFTAQFGFHILAIFPE